MTGQLEYSDRGSSVTLHSATIASLAIAGTTATFSGTCATNGQPCTFAVTVTDSGEPGASDTLAITVSVGYAAGGTLRGGNIQVHK